MIDPSIRLRRAIQLGDVLLVQRIVRSNPKLLQNPDFTNKCNTSLHLAASLGSLTICTYLVDAGHEDVEISRNMDNDTPLHLAAKDGHVEVGQYLAETFPRGIGWVNKLGIDVLGIASSVPAATALLPVLLQNGASVDVRDINGDTPLHHASASGSLKALRILLSAGANPLANNNYDWTPLAYSQTVAAEVYFKNLVAEFERRKVEGAKLGEERERQRAAGVRLVEDNEGKRSGEGDEDEVIGDALKRHWSPTDRRRPGTPGSAPRHEWGLGMGHVRTRSGSAE
ncbi:ankyrin [Teratosphaeria nubilosa]|uniref:Ankyrin n=1 Tax=Teratosphaeria nubilosa TaxID=161662 RepID=A0A6G1KTG1_9PEZI|nr:ankyrin [Teratosphaeria nubilosa]